MSSDDGIPEPSLHDIVHQVIDRLHQLEARLGTVEDTLQRLRDDEKYQRTQPAPWVWVPPPPVSSDLRTELVAFVHWYNATYVGLGDGRTHRIPTCWYEHSGLPEEIAVLAAAWRKANIGRSAHPRDAITWHHQWRPGFVDRMVRDWLHPDCLDGDHKPTGDRQIDRFTAAERDTDNGERPTTQPDGSPVCE